MPEQDLPYDSFLLVSFGGPEGPDDVMPFLENVLRGKNVPQERMLEVAEHYQQFGGVSPINEQNRQLITALREEFDRSGVELPIYWGNRNWDPLLPDTLQQMKEDGCKRAIAFFTSIFSSYSGCRQYRENIQAAQDQVGQGAPQVDKVRMGFNHPGFIETVVDEVSSAIEQLGVTTEEIMVLFTAHSIPMSMADHCDYVKQLNEASRLVAGAVDVTNWHLVYQSRSGPPQQPWLEPDVCDAIEHLDDSGKLKKLIIVPIGFVSDHMEVIYDLDDEAAALCEQRGIKMIRVATPGVSPKFVSMVRELVQERLGTPEKRRAVGELGPWHDVCPENCCQYKPQRPAARP
ncbi:ferrochelatase [Stieleria sp. TO1_6]|uniref:ferrochelatase n=1 Tax=Stieleria tagensis TaxID=2956795 RepID=UPI00209A9AC1|nr:ferrochelatase [Stieleria tagensis]MCO8120821.1 ferrochelatase [Stieleria tagensis]